MGEKPNWGDHITNTQEYAEHAGGVFLELIEECGRKDILENNPTVLDLGGGKGEFSKYLNEKKIPLDKKDWNAVPCSNSVQGDAYQMPFEDGSFNVIYGYGTFDSGLYAHDFPKLMEEIVRVLKPSGVLVIRDATPPPNEEIEKYFTLLSDPKDKYLTLWEKK